MRYDVIVSGAGPAGSTTARECASRGLSVLLFDKSEFPRDKPCGGAVTIRAAGLLPFELTPVIERVITGIRVTERRSRGFTRSSSQVVTYLTQRSRLDSFLVECAVDAGVAFRQREGVRQVQRHSTHVVVRTKESSFEGSTLVAADGANGPTARLAGVNAGFIHGIAIEGNVTPPDGVPPEWEATIGMDMGGVPGGYGWIFPKGDHLNIGIGGWKFIAPTLRERLGPLVRFYGYDPSDMWGIRGHHLPVRQPDSPLVDGNVVLIGDAAGLVDPLFGEGIFAAMWSGLRAAEQIAYYVGGKVKDLEGYRREVERVLAPELSASHRFHDLFHLWPGLFLGVERKTSVLLTAVEYLLSGEKTYLTLQRKLKAVWPVVEFISDMVRVSPTLRRISGMRDPVAPERFFRSGAQHSAPRFQADHANRT